MPCIYKKEKKTFQNLIFYSETKKDERRVSIAIRIHIPVWSNLNVVFFRNKF
jgi:hypothetical protein